MAIKYIFGRTQIDQTRELVDITCTYIPPFETSSPPSSCASNIPHIKSSFVSTVPVVVNGTQVQEGDLYLNLECYPEYIKVRKDGDGSLMITVYDEREESYEINDSGDLTFDLEN